MRGITAHRVPKGPLAWQGRQLRPPVASLQSQGFAPVATRAGLDVLRPVRGPSSPCDPDGGSASATPLKGLRAPENPGGGVPAPATQTKAIAPWNTRQSLRAPTP